MSTPIQADGPRTIAANSVTLIVTDDGRVYASGAAQPARGDDEVGTRNFFKPISSLRGIKEVDVYSDASGNAAAVDHDGFVWLWGNHWHKTLDVNQPAHVPFKHPTLKDIASIAMGEYHLVALEKSGSVLTVVANDSSNLYGATGNGQSGYRSSDQPVVHRIAGVNDAVAIEASPTATFVLRADGTVWGCGDRPMLTPTKMAGFDAVDPEKMSVPRLTQINGLSKITTLSAGLNFVIALDANGQVWGWGTNDSGQLGRDVTDIQSIAPRKLRGLNRIMAISAGRDFLTAVTKSGKVVAQGCNVHGTLGDDGDELEGDQRTIAKLGSAKQVFAGEFNAFARTKDGSLLGWGNNAPDAGGFAPAHDPFRLGVTKFSVQDKAPKASETLLSGGVKAIVLVRHNDYFFTSEKLKLTIGNARSLDFEVHASKDEQKQIVEIPAGKNSCTIHGTVIDDEGRKFEVKSEAVVYVSDKSFEDHFNALVDNKGLIPAIAETIETFTDDGLSDSYSSEKIDAWSEKDFEAYETEENVKLPAAYKKAAMEIGFFSLGHRDSPHPLVSFLPPVSKRTLERYATEAMAADCEKLPDGPYKDLCSGLPYTEPAVPTQRADWRHHLIVGSADEQLHLLIRQRADQPLCNTWTGLLESDSENYNPEDPDGFFNWEERHANDDYQQTLTKGAYTALITILQQHGIAPLVASPSNEAVYLEIHWPSEEEPDQGDILKYLLGTDGW